MGKKEKKIKKQENIRQKKAKKNEEKEARKAKAAELSRQAEEKGEQDYKELLLQEEEELDSLETRIRKGNQIQIEELVAIIVLIILCGLLFFWQHQVTNQLEEAKRVISTLDMQIAELKTNEEDLIAAANEQQEKIQLLSDTLTSKTEQLTAYQDQESAQHVPSGYPVRGAAAILSGDLMDTDNSNAEDDDLDNSDFDDNDMENPNDIIDDDEIIVEPSIEFMVSEGTCIIATGSGQIIDIELDEEGNSLLTIDHGNGYESLYKCIGLVFVNVGDSVSTGSVLMSITEEGSLFEYQIIYEGNYINPKECMVING